MLTVLRSDKFREKIEESGGTDAMVKELTSTLASADSKPVDTGDCVDVTMEYISRSFATGMQPEASSTTSAGAAPSKKSITRLKIKGRVQVEIEEPAAAAAGAAAEEEEGDKKEDVSSRGRKRQRIQHSEFV